MPARRGAAVAVLAIVASAFAGPAVAGTGPAPAATAAGLSTGWSVGAAKVDITPPAYRAADDARDFPTCDATVFTGARAFDFEEPYADQNANGVYDFGEPYCDANANTRWDGIFISGGVAEVATTVHDRLYARAFAIGHGNSSAVVASITAQGIFKNYVDDIRALALSQEPRIAGIVVSANHNESSPDTVGIYGAPSIADTAGGRSGIDDYYMTWLEQQVATAVVTAYENERPGTVRVAEVPVPDALAIRLSDNFPTTDDSGRAAAVDGYARVLQGVDASGTPVFTVLNLAAHNQEVGHHSEHAGELSEDWPGYFERKLDADIGGTSIFLVGDNGSIEDPALDHDGTYAHVQASGEGFAALVESALPSAVALTPGEVRLATSTFDVPLQNNLFVAAAAAGLFGKRTVDPAGASAQGPAALQTETGVLDVGPDLQLLLWPGETFPALAVGGPWGVEDAPCADRANPPVPTWHAGATWRFQVGLADDMLGYLLPPWAFATTPGTTQSTCTTDQDDKDSKGHQHKLEDESVGWDAAGDIATHLTALLDHDPVAADPAATVRTGRFVRPDGSLSRSPAGAVGLWITAPFATTLPSDPPGLLIALPGVRAFGTGAGAVVPDAYGEFIDDDGRPQPGGPDLATRGMAVVGSDGSVARRWYADVYPALTTTPLGPADTGPGTDLPEVPLAVLLPLAAAAALAIPLLRRRR